MKYQVGEFFNSMLIFAFCPCRHCRNKEYWLRCSFLQVCSQFASVALKIYVHQIHHRNGTHRAQWNDNNLMQYVEQRSVWERQWFFLFFFVLSIRYDLKCRIQRYFFVIRMTTSHTRKKNCWKNTWMMSTVQAATNQARWIFWHSSEHGIKNEKYVKPMFIWHNNFVHSRQAQNCLPENKKKISTKIFINEI